MLRVILLLIIAICITIIYDARKICEKYFSSSMKNKQVKMLKITGFLVAIISAILFIII